MKKKLFTKTKSSNKVWIIKSRKSLKYKKYKIIANIKGKKTYRLNSHSLMSNQQEPEKERPEKIKRERININ